MCAYRASGQRAIANFFEDAPLPKVERDGHDLGG
jgi:hypothetical protein